MAEQAKIDDGGPAFPQNLPDNFVWRLPGDPGGMTIRDWFAGKALAGLLAMYGKDELDDVAMEQIAGDAYRMAGHMLKAKSE